MKDIKVLFMGTPVFSVPILKALIDNTNVVGVVTAPDAYVGRKKVLTMCPVKELALSSNIPVHSPSKIREDFNFIKELNPDIIITCAYGQIISEEILNMPKYGCINVHASLLPNLRGGAPIPSAILDYPKYKCINTHGSLLPRGRGGAPIQHSLIDGDAKTGITLMYMDKGMDSGDMIYKEEIIIDNKDNIETLSNKLSLLAANMIIKYLPELINKTNPREKQNIDEVTFAPIIKREDEHLDFSLSAKEVYNKFRALSPNSLPNFYINNIEYKIAECEVVDINGETNKIIEANKNGIIIKCKDKGIKITKIKPIGKNIMEVKDFLNGYHDNIIGEEVK